MTDEEIIAAQKDGPWLLVTKDGGVRSVQPGSEQKHDGKVVQVLHLGRSLSMSDCKRLIGLAKSWGSMSVKEREALLLSDPHGHGVLAQAAARVRDVS